MDDLARAEYPAMLAHLQPGQAIQVLNDRVKRITKTNSEITDWLQERRRVEEQYVSGLRKLANFRVPNAQSELGAFQTPWARILGAVERIAQSHHQLAQGIERDVELPLRSFHQRDDAHNMSHMSTNLSSACKDLEDAREKSDKLLNKKMGRTSSQKLDAVSTRLETAQQEWDSQAPFVFETLQALDESRVNQLRDALTQYQTHESDQAQRTQSIAGETLAVVIDIATESEIRAFAQGVVGHRPLTSQTTSVRPSSIGTAANNASQPPPVPPGTARETTIGSTLTPTPSASQAAPTDDSFEPAQAPQKGSKLRRLGTILGGRRRKSFHAGFGQLSAPKGARLGSSGRSMSPRASASNLNETGRLSSLAEDEPPSPVRPKTDGDRPNGTSTIGADAPVLPALPATTNGSLVEVGSSCNQDKAGVGASLPQKDADGFDIRAPMHDPITVAQREAAAGEESEQPFKLSIQKQPILEEDPKEKQAALSSVANTLKLNSTTVQRARTVRGRRDVRNTIYNPVGSLPDALSESSFTSILAGRPAAVSALASEPSLAGGGGGVSDSQSVRSGTSLGNFAQLKHPDMTGPGLNSSIIEAVSVQFENGGMKNVSVSGEIAFAYNDQDGHDKTHETIRINNFARLEKIGPNRIFVQNASIEFADQFTLDLSHISQTSAAAFSYRLFSDEDGKQSPSLSQAQSQSQVQSFSALGGLVPLLLKTAWKPQGDKLGLVLQYQRNPACALPAPVTLHGVVLVARYEGRAAGAQTKPTGTHLKEKHLVYWRLGDVVLTDETQRIVCRILGVVDGSSPAPGHVEARWEYVARSGGGGGGGSGSGDGAAALASGISVSCLGSAATAGEEGKGKFGAGGGGSGGGDPFADADGASSVEDGQVWMPVPLTRKLVSGKYEGR